MDICTQGDSHNVVLLLQGERHNEFSMKSFAKYIMSTTNRSPIRIRSGSNSHPASDIHKIQREKSVTLREGACKVGSGW